MGKLYRATLASLLCLPWLPALASFPGLIAGEEPGHTPVASAVHACHRQERSLTYHGSPATVYASPNQWAEVVFPEILVGELVENRQGIEVRRPPNFRDRAYIQVSDGAYFGSVFVHGISGSTFHLRVLAREGCADSTVRIVTYAEDVSQKDAAPASTSTSTQQRTLMETMLAGEQPPRGFHKDHLEGSPYERLVFRQGPISFYVKEVWQGRRQTGTILLVENDGRTPYRVAIEAINYASPELRQLFGRVREVAMLPSDLTLGPAPAFAADIYNPRHRGMILIVSEKEAHGRR